MIISVFSQIMLFQPFLTLFLILCDLPVQAVHIGEFLFVPQEMQQFHPTGLFVQVAGKVQQKRFCRRQLCFADSGLDSNIRNGIKAALWGVRP